MGTVLVVDDSPMVRNELMSIVSMSGARVEEAADGSEAWCRLASDDEIDLVLCDINMKPMSGLELLRKAHEHGLTARTPFVMVTTEVKASMLKEAKGLGARGWVVKPPKASAIRGYVECFVTGNASRRT